MTLRSFVVKNTIRLLAPADLDDSDPRAHSANFKSWTHETHRAAIALTGNLHDLPVLANADLVAS